MVSRTKALGVCLAVSACLAAAAAAAAMRPPPAPALAPHVTSRELVTMRGLSGLEVSPDGNFAAIRIDQQDLDSNRTRLDWQVIPLRGGAIVRISDGGGQLFSVNGGLATERPQWSPDGRWLYFRALAGEELQLWRARRSGSGREQVTHNAADILAFDVKRNGSVLIAAAGATRAEIRQAEQEDYDAGVLFDQTLIPGFAVTHNFPVNGRMATLRAPKPNAFFRKTLLGDRPPNITMISSAGGGERAASPQDIARFEPDWSYGAGRFGVSGVGRFKSLSSDPAANGDEAVSGRGDRIADLLPVAGSAHGRVLFWRLAATGADKVICTASVCTEADSLAIIGWSGPNLVFQTVTHGSEAIHLWNTSANDVRTLVSGEAALGSDASGRNGVCKLARREVVCIAAAADTPPRVVAIDIDTAARRILFDPNPALTPDRLGRAEKITLHDRFGRTTLGRLILPNGQARSTDERLPLVITSYSCPGFLLGGTGEDVPEHVLAGMGYAALCVDTTVWTIRGPDGFRANQLTTNQATIDFFEDAVRILDQRGLIDPQRVAVSGFSGSATGIAWGLVHSKAFTAAIITTRSGNDPISCYLLAMTGKCRRAGQRAGLSPPYDPVAALSTDSPALGAAAITTPLLMQLAEAEYLDNLQLYAALVDLDRPVELRVFPGEFHIKRQPRHRLAVYERNVQWIDFWLRGREEAGASLSVQYKRWREQRELHCRRIADLQEAASRPWYCETEAR